MYVCEACGVQVRPASEVGTVFAVRVVRTDVMGPTTGYSDGLPVVFHEECFPIGSTQYRQKPRPDRIDGGDE